MPDMDEMKEGKKYYTDVPQQTEGFFLKGSNALDWGMKNRLARIFNPKTGRTVMLAVDHGYFQGPTTGLERIDINILPLVPYADTLMLTRGILRSIVPPSVSQSIVLRVSGGTSILKELSNEEIAVDIEDSIRLNVCAMAVQVFIGGEYERQSIINMTTMVDWGNRYGIPTLAVTAVGKDMARDARYFRLACRICAELGAHYVKTYYIEKDFETLQPEMRLRDLIDSIARSRRNIFPVENHDRRLFLVLCFDNPHAHCSGLLYFAEKLNQSSKLGITRPCIYPTGYLPPVPIN